MRGITQWHGFYCAEGAKKKARCHPLLGGTSRRVSVRRLFGDHFLDGLAGGVDEFLGEVLGGVGGGLGGVASGGLDGLLGAVDGLFSSLVGVVASGQTEHAGHGHGKKYFLHHSVFFV